MMLPANTAITATFMLVGMTNNDAERSYFALLEEGVRPQLARDVLPNSLKTEIVMTTNPREWRHVFKLRCAEAAHPQMREVMIPCRNEFAARWPALFADLTESAR